MRQFKLLLMRLLLSLLWTWSSSASADPENKAVGDTIQQYIDGSSYSERDVIVGAFHSDATLYLTAKTGFARFTPDEYADFFAHREPGAFNGRIGKILSIEVVKDIAMAKASITIPKRNLLYIDLFLLRKTADKWQIISKTATRIVED